MKERNIKMSLETAKKTYQVFNGMHTESTLYEPLRPLYDDIVKNFTKSELEGKKGITWEEAFTGEGWFICTDSAIKCEGVLPCVPGNHNVFLTEAHAKSALAFAQLSFIVAKANEGKGFKGHYHTISKLNNKLQGDEWSSLRHHLEFFTAEDRDISMVENKELWEQYHMIERK